MGEIINYGSNSDNAKNRPDQDRIRPIEDEEVTPRTNWLREFIVGNVEDARAFVIRDVIIPSLHRMIVDISQTFLTTLFDGTPTNSKTRRDYSLGRTSSGLIRSGYPSKDPDAEPSTVSLFTEKGKPSRGTVELALQTLQELIERNGYVNVRDYYDALGVSSNNAAYDNHYGWTDLRMCSVRYRWTDGLYYITNLPRPKYIDN